MTDTNTTDRSAVAGNVTYTPDDFDHLAETTGVDPDWTTLGVKEDDLALIEDAKVQLDRENSSNRQFVMFLIDSHPEIDSDRIWMVGIEQFVRAQSGDSE